MLPSGNLRPSKTVYRIAVPGRWTMSGRQGETVVEGGEEEEDGTKSATLQIFPPVGSSLLTVASVTLLESEIHLLQESYG